MLPKGALTVVALVSETIVLNAAGRVSQHANSMRLAGLPEGGYMVRVKKNPTTLTQKLEKLDPGRLERVEQISTELSRPRCESPRHGRMIYSHHLPSASFDGYPNHHGLDILMAIKHGHIKVLLTGPVSLPPRIIYQCPWCRETKAVAI